MTGPDRRTFRYNIIIDSDTHGSDKTGESLERVDKSAGKAEKGLADLKKESERLDVQLAKSRTKVKELEQELIKTGDRTTGRGSLRQSLSSERSWLRELERLSKSATDVVAEAESKAKTRFRGLLHDGITETFTPALTEGISVSFRNAFENMPSMRGAAIGSLVGLAVAASPLIGAVISGAVAGTVAGGGIAGGVIAASADTRVRGAFKDLVSEFTSEAFGGGAFVEPVVKGLYILRDAFKNLHLDEVLAKGASSVPILAQGIGDLVTNFMPGFNKVMDQAETFTTIFAQGLGDTGAALSDFLESIMSSEGTIEGLAAGFKLLDGSIIALGNILQWLGDRFHDIVSVEAWVTGKLEDFVYFLEGVARSTTQVLTFGMVNLDNNHGLSRTLSWLNDNLEGIASVGWQAAGAAGGVAKVIRELPDPTEEAADAFKKLNDEFERSIDLQAALLTDQIDWEQGLQDLADTLAENGAVLNTTTDEGRANEKALIAMAKQARQLRDDQIALGGSTADANATLEANHQRLLDQAEAAGISRQAVEDLIGALFRVPKLNFMGTGNPAGSSNSTFGGGFQEFDTGGIVQGPPGSAQMVVAHAGERVLTKDQQRRYSMPNSDMGSGGGSQVTISFAATGDPLLDAFIKHLRKFVRVEGGGDVQVALGQN